MNEHRIITISRQFGSGGRSVGRLAAEKLGIRCYDNELIARLAEESGFAEEYVKRDSEYLRSNWFTGFSAGYTTPQDNLWFAQCRVIRDIAEKESCVIVGRCADYILREHPNCLNVYLHASPEFRADRIVNLYKDESDLPVEKRIREKDRSRAAYYLHYTVQEWGDAKNYDVCLDTGTLGIEKCAEIITALY